MSSCGERRTALHRYSLGFGPRGEKNSAGCIPLKGKGYRNSGEGRAERCLDQRDTNTSAVQLRRDLCRNPTRGAPACKKAALLANSAPPADDSGLISARFSHSMISSSNVISVNVLTVLPGEQARVMIRTKCSICLLCTPPKATC